MKISQVIILLILILYSCKTSDIAETKTEIETRTKPIPKKTTKYGGIVLEFGSDHIESNEFSGYLTVDTVADKSRLTLSMHDFLEGNDTLYNIFELKVNLNHANHKPELTTYKLNERDKIRYHVNGSKGTPYFPVNAEIKLTHYDSIDPHTYKLSGKFNFYAAKKKYIIKKGETDFSKARMEFFDSVLVNGKFDTIYFNYFYNEILEQDEYSQYADTIPLLDN
jgi:hypothetical protein